MDQATAPPPGCTVLVTLLDGTVMNARCRGVEGGGLLLFTRDGRPADDVTVVLRWDHAGEAYEAAGVVASDAGSEAAWLVELTQGPVKARCRRHPRVPVHIPVTIDALTGAAAADASPVEGVAVDISVGGMRVSLECFPQLQRGDEVEVAFAVDGAVLRCPARIAHTAVDRGDVAVFEFGLVFSDLTPDAVNVVTAIVDSVFGASAT